MAKLSDLVSRSHENVFDTNRNIMIQYPKKQPKMPNQTTSFRYVSPSADFVKKIAQILAAIILCSAAVMAITLALTFSLKLDKIATPSVTNAPTTTKSSFKSIGQACTKSSECIATAQCDVGTGSGGTSVCVCSPQLYLDASSGGCLARKEYGSSCTTSLECEWSINLSCVGGVCTCDSTYFFYNPQTGYCEDRKGLGEVCIGASGECLSNLECYYYYNLRYTTCNCPWYQYFSFQTGVCTNKKTIGTQCNQNAHFECIYNAVCTLFPNEASTYRCSCYPTMYYNGSQNFWSCLPKKAYSSSCISTFECLDNDEQQCYTTGCFCRGNRYWNNTYCVPHKSLGGDCTSQGQCLYGSPNYGCYNRPELETSGCMCAAGYYFVLFNRTCSALLTIGSVCVDNYQCPLNSSCVYQASTSNRICVCDSDYYYASSSTQCSLLKGYRETCTSSTECKSLLGLICDTSTNTCNCPSGWFHNGVECELQIGADGGTYNKYCTWQYACKSSLSKYNCYGGRCICVGGTTLSASGLVCS